MDYESYKKLLKVMRMWYKTIGKVYCPCLNEFVIFNSKGFRHFRFHGNGKERTVADQIERFKRLPAAIQLIKQASKIHENRTSADGKKSFLALQGTSFGKNIRVVLIKASAGQMVYISVVKAGSQKDHQ